MRNTWVLVLGSDEYSPEGATQRRANDTEQNEM